MSQNPNDRLSIKDWLKEDRPREKLATKGARQLTDTELLTILIGTGTRDSSAMDLARQLLQAYQGDLHAIYSSPFSKLSSAVKGIGPAKAINIMAALELGVRLQGLSKTAEVHVNSSDTALGIIKPMLHGLKEEHFVALFLGPKLNLIHQETLAKGGAHSTVIDVRVVVQKAMEHGADAIILAHNHPSGILKPSKQDIAFTQDLLKACKLFSLRLIEHFIYADQADLYGILENYPEILSA